MITAWAKPLDIHAPVHIAFQCFSFFFVTVPFDLFWKKANQTVVKYSLHSGPGL